MEDINQRCFRHALLGRDFLPINFQQILDMSYITRFCADWHKQQVLGSDQVQLFFCCFIEQICLSVDTIAKNEAIRVVARSLFQKGLKL